MKHPYLKTLGVIWLIWLAGFLGSNALANTQGSDVALVVVWLWFFLGIPLAGMVSVIACGAIACDRWGAAFDRRRAGRG